MCHRIKEILLYELPKCFFYYYDNLNVIYIFTNIPYIISIFAILEKKTHNLASYVDTVS